jgi:hypothetical protein
MIIFLQELSSVSKLFVHISSFGVAGQWQWALDTDVTSARLYRPSFRKNNPKTLVFKYAWFIENWVYKFGYRGTGLTLMLDWRS